MKTLAMWKSKEYGGLVMRSENDKSFREGNVHQGGNDLWSASVAQYDFGPWNKRKSRRYASKNTFFKYMDKQTETRTKAVKWVESVWIEMEEMPADGAIRTMTHPQNMAVEARKGK